MIRFDADQQRWVDHDAETLLAEQHKDSARQQRQAAKGALAVLAVCGLVFGAWALGWKDEPVPPGGGSQSPAVAPDDPDATSRPGRSAPGESDESAGSTDPAGPTDSGPPEGYEIQEDSEGFSLAVPKGWDRRTEERDGPQAVFYENSSGSKQLQIFWVEDSDPYESLKLAEKNAEKNEHYERKSLDRLDGGDGSAARLEYTYDSDEHGGARRVVDHRFEAADGELYAVIAYAPDKDGASKEEKERLDTALAFFCPTGVDCQADSGGGGSGGADGDDGLGNPATP
ncbi:hypothetical protein HCC61_06495 [Streptomyces sp. HNM0575]|uniref:hypothetical protein n=1 Tax=Streptomyces sp. HNM0575 TaxID=2716338 RepID=UPI00145E7A46|nr:hypothetical protein [Streptomyces sp. HNM0575]NLU72332.1 hypothetical protein [Streptomyces sp. HNM0575]